MKEGLQLKIGLYWCALKEDTSINIEMTSPLWNESGSFSYPFTIPYEANRHIFNSAELPESDINLKSFRESFELYVDGIGLLFGDVICTGDEIDLDDDSIELELRAGNASLNDAIEGKTLRDLDYSDIDLGEYIERLTDPRSNEKMISIKEYVNETAVYPAKEYCNIPILANYKDGDNTKGICLSARRACSSPCFFILSLFKRIFRFAQFAYDESKDCALMEVEDFKRMILVNTLFDYKKGESIGTTSVTESRKKLLFSPECISSISLDTFIQSFCNAFGMKISIDSNLRTAKIMLFRDLFRKTERTQLKTSELFSITKIHQPFNGIKIKYGTDDGEEFSYDSYKNEIVYDNYNSLISAWEGMAVKETDIMLRISKETGNFYRTKVDDSTFDQPALFEVAQFVPYRIEGIENANKEDEEEITIDFVPAISTAKGSCIQTTPYNPTELERNYNYPDETIFVNQEVIYGGFKFVEARSHDHDSIEWTDHLENTTALDRFIGAETKNVENIAKNDLGFTVGILRTTPDGSLADGYEIVKTNSDNFGNSSWVQTTSDTTVSSDSVTKEGQIYDYNGTDEGTGIPMDEYISLKLWAGKQGSGPVMENVPIIGEGGEVTGWEEEVVYDNNPTGPLPNRGLVPQFLSEYIHFLKNRKTLEIVVRMEAAEISGIQWDEYYEIAGYRCFIDKVSLTASSDGMDTVTLRVYCI